MTDALNVLITGASSGIGAEVARVYARRGARVALFARRKDRLDEVAADCREQGAGDTLVLAGDTTDRRRVGDAAAEIIRAWGDIDRAFLNAGTSGSVTAEDFDAEVAEHVMNVNYIGVVNWIEPVLAHMLERGTGTIAATGSLAADQGIPYEGSYGASKVALRSLIDSLRPDAARYGVAFVLIEPGFTESELTAENDFEMPFMLETTDAARRIVDGIEQAVPVVRFPWQLSWASRIGSMLPRVVRDPVLMRIRGAVDRH